MKLFIAFAAIMAVALAAPQREYEVPEVVVLKENLHDNIGIGGYKYSYELSDGQAREEVADVINAGTENEALRVIGSYTWVDANGQSYTVNYIADENGFQPQGAHLPTV